MVSELEHKVKRILRRYRRQSIVLDVIALDMNEDSSTGTDSDNNPSIAKPSPNLTFSISAPAHPKSIPVAPWSITCSGSPRYMSVGAFLERVSELKVSRNCSDVTLFNAAVDLFTGPALIWYRANRALYVDWKELSEALREEDPGL